MFDLLSEDGKKQIKNELVKEHSILFKNYFNSEDELKDFISRNLAPSIDNIQRRSINNVQRLVTLADELTVVKPGKWDLAIFFLLSCIESIYKLNGMKIQKQEMIIDFFEKYISTDDQDLIRKRIEIIEIYDGGKIPPHNYKITMERFSLLLISVRNMVTHEGVYWNLKFIQEDEEDRTPIMQGFLAKTDKDSPYYKVAFMNTMKFSELRDIFIKGYINFIKQHELENALN